MSPPQVAPHVSGAAIDLTLVDDAGVALDLGTPIDASPTEWWHWSYGDRYWALVTGAAAAIYGPVDEEDRLPPGR